MGIPPWLMWSTEVALDVSGGNTNVSGQTARIDYGRPDTWSFLFTASLSDVVVAATTPTLTLAFDVTLGLGRTSVNIPDFEFYQWELPADNTILKRSTQVIGPPRVSGSAIANILDEFCAQSINVKVRAALLGITATSARIHVATYFAPKSHIRPEWFEGGTFNGGENNGT